MTGMARVAAMMLTTSQSLAAATQVTVYQAAWRER